MKEPSQLLGTTFSIVYTLKVLLTHSSPQFHTPLETTTSNLALPTHNNIQPTHLTSLTPSPPDSSLLTPPHLFTSVEL